jgi:Serine aminopeptidase, S33
MGCARHLFGAWVNDLATVVDAVRLECFPLFGLSQGCAVSIAHAVRNPDRVSHLILSGGFALGASKRKPEERERRNALVTLLRLEWGADNPALRQMFANYLMPGVTKEEVDTFNELQRKTASAECAARYFEAAGAIDVVELLPQINTPTLVIHARGDAQVPFELGRQLAAAIPGAKFVALQSNNHLLLEDDPATQRLDQTIFGNVENTGRATPTHQVLLCSIAISDRWGPKWVHFRPIGAISGMSVGAIFLKLIFDQPKSLLAAVEEQVPKGASAEDASRFLEGEERYQRDEEDGGDSHKAGH